MAVDAVCGGVLGLGGAAGDEARQAARDELVVRFGQTTGPVLAKGVEDTAFYRWPRLASLNEVGGDPGRFGVSAAEFHAAAGRLAGLWPATMTTLSTHDTKRQEDVRARLAVLAEWPQDWAHKVAEWHGLASWLTDGAVAQATERAPDPDLEYLTWQTLVGAWLIGGERLREYLGKAMHEAKTRTSWTVRDPGYEAAVLGLADAVLARPGAGGRDRGVRGAHRAGRQGELARRQARAAHHAGGGRCLPGVRAHRPVAGGIRTTGGRSTSERRRLAAGRAALYAKRTISGLGGPRCGRKSCSPAARWSCAGTTLGGSPHASYTPAGLRGTGRRGTPSRSCAASTRSPSSPGCPPPAAARRLGRIPVARPLPGLHWRDVLTGTRHAGLRPPLGELTVAAPVAWRC